MTLALHIGGAFVSGVVIDSLKIKIARIENFA
jgi:hypothetical protein